MSLTLSLLDCPDLQSTVAQASSHCILFPPKLPSPRTCFWLFPNGPACQSPLSALVKETRHDARLLLSQHTVIGIQTDEQSSKFSLAVKKVLFLSGFTLTLHWGNKGRTCNNMCFQLGFWNTLHAIVCVFVMIPKPRLQNRTSEFNVYLCSLAITDKEAECHGSADRHLWSRIQANLLRGSDKLKRLWSDASCRITNVIPDHGRFGKIAVVLWNNEGLLSWVAAVVACSYSTETGCSSAGWRRQRRRARKTSEGQTQLTVQILAFGKRDQLSVGWRCFPQHVDCSLPTKL